MDKKKTIIALFAIIAIFSAYYALSLDFVKPGIEQVESELSEVSSPVPAPQRIDRARLKTDYENKFRICLKNYETVIVEQIELENGAKMTWTAFFEKLNETREDLLVMTVPEDFKNSHLETVLAVSRINEIFQSQDEENFNTAKELLAQVKAINTELIN